MAAVVPISTSLPNRHGRSLSVDPRLPRNIPFLGWGDVCQADRIVDEEDGVGRSEIALPKPEERIPGALRSPRLWPAGAEQSR